MLSPMPGLSSIPATIIIRHFIPSPILMVLSKCSPMPPLQISLPLNCIRTYFREHILPSHNSPYVRRYTNNGMTLLYVKYAPMSQHRGKDCTAKCQGDLVKLLFTFYNFMTFVNGFKVKRFGF